MGERRHAQPTGTVSFLFTDLVDHTRLWEQHPEQMGGSLRRHDEILRTAIEAHAGYVFSTSGDAFGAAFATVESAVAAAIEAQQRLADEPWPPGCELRARMGLHTGEAQERDGDYFGPVVIRTARLMGLGHGGQVLVSGLSAGLLADRPEYAPMVRELGDVALRGLGRAERVHELRYPGLDEEFPPVTEPAPVGGNLPLPADELIGRTEELADAVGRLSTGSLVTLTGPGGVGKTRLAVEAGRRVSERFGDGTWFVPLAAVTDAGSVPDAAAEVLGVQVTAGRSVTEAIVGAIGGRELLLVVDNCEHVIEGARRFIDAVVHETGSVSVVATSREPLGVGGEQVLPVEPLPTGGADAPAVELFAARARAADPGFALDAATAAAAQVICERLDGMPLAIELAAARVRGLGLSGLVEHLGDRFRLLRRPGDADPRHQTLRATVEWSYDLLDARLQRLFCRAGVFAGGFELAAAEAVLADGGLDALDVADGLAELVDKSMLQVGGGPTGRRYRMLETMRQFGADVADADDLERTRRRFVTHRAQWCVELAHAQAGPDVRSAMDRLRADFDNAREALRSAVERDLLDEAVAITLAMEEFGGRSVNGEPSLWAAELVERTPPDHPRYGDLLGAAIWGCRRRGDLERMRRLLVEFDAFDAVGGLDSSPRGLHVVGMTYWFLRETERAVALQRRALALVRATGDRAYEAYCLSTLSMAEDSFDRPQAEASARASLAIGREIGSPMSVCGGLLSLAGVVLHGDPRRAAELAHELAGTARAEGILWYEATGVRVEAHALSRDGDLSAASATFVRALDLNGVGDHGELLWYTVLNVVEHLVRIHRPRAAAAAVGALVAAPAAPTDDLVARALDRLRSRIGTALADELPALEAEGGQLRLAELIRLLRTELLDDATTTPPTGAAPAPSR